MEQGEAKVLTEASRILSLFPNAVAPSQSATDAATALAGASVLLSHNISVKRTETARRTVWTL